MIRRGFLFLILLGVAQQGFASSIHYAFGNRIYQLNQSSVQSALVDVDLEHKEKLSSSLEFDFRVSAESKGSSSAFEDYRYLKQKNKQGFELFLPKAHVIGKRNFLKIYLGVLDQRDFEPIPAFRSRGLSGGAFDLKLFSSYLVWTGFFANYLSEEALLHQSKPALQLMKINSSIPFKDLEVNFSVSRYGFYSLDGSIAYKSHWKGNDTGFVYENGSRFLHGFSGTSLHLEIHDISLFRPVMASLGWSILKNDEALKDQKYSQILESKWVYKENTFKITGFEIGEQSMPGAMLEASYSRVNTLGYDIFYGHQLSSYNLYARVNTNRSLVKNVDDLAETVFEFGLTGHFEIL